MIDDISQQQSWTNADLIARLDNAIEGLAKRVSELVDELAVKAEPVGSFAHFTSLATLALILENAGKRSNHRLPLVLRLTDVRYLNDPEEGRALNESLASAPLRASAPYLDPREIHTFSPEEIRTINTFKEWTKRDPKLDSLAAGIEAAAEPGEYVFVSSFTHESDSLDLWRAYGKDGEGVSLSMPFVRALATLSDHASQGFRLYAVKYDDDAKFDAWEYLVPKIKEIIDCSGNIPCSEIQLLEGAKKRVRRLMNELHHLYKHERFKSEREIRLLHVGDIGDEIKADVRTNKLYCESPPFFLGESGGTVTIGPSVRHADLWQRTLSVAVSRLWPENPPNVVQSQFVLRHVTPAI